MWEVKLWNCSNCKTADQNFWHAQNPPHRQTARLLVIRAINQTTPLKEIITLAWTGPILQWVENPWYSPSYYLENLVKWLACYLYVSQLCVASKQDCLFQNAASIQKHHLWLLTCLFAARRALLWLRSSLLSSYKSDGCNLAHLSDNSEGFWWARATTDISFLFVTYHPHAANPHVGGKCPEPRAAHLAKEWNIKLDIELSVLQQH